MGRSPAYPGIDLEEALAKAKALYEAEGKYAVPMASAFTAWGFSPKSSGAREIRAAMRYYGLISIEGDGETGKIKLADEALRVLLDEREDQTEKKALIRRLALNPGIHKKLFEKFPDGIKSDAATSVKPARPSVKIGDYVQWESNGVLQLPEPKRVTGISDAGDYVFVEGSSTGLPISEVTSVPAPQAGALQNAAQGGAAPAMLNAPLKPAPLGARQDVFSLDEGQVILQWPAKLSAASYEEFESWIQLQLRKIKRGIEQ